MGQHDRGVRRRAVFSEIQPRGRIQCALSCHQCFLPCCTTVLVSRKRPPPPALPALHAAPAGTASPVSTGKDGSLPHCVQDPSYTCIRGSPNFSKAKATTQAETPDPHEHTKRVFCPNRTPRWRMTAASASSGRYVCEPGSSKFQPFVGAMTRCATSPAVQAGKDSADGAAVLVFGFQCGVCCCSMYWRTMEIGAPPQLEAK